MRVMFLILFLAILAYWTYRESSSNWSTLHMFAVGGNMMLSALIWSVWDCVNELWKTAIIIVTSAGIMGDACAVLHMFFLVEFVQAMCRVVHCSLFYVVVLEELDFAFKEIVVVDVCPLWPEVMFDVKVVLILVLCSDDGDRLLVVEPFCLVVGDWGPGSC
jgi:hypothetical protein